MNNRNGFVPMNLQLFAETPAARAQAAEAPQGDPAAQTPAAGAQAVDYAKIQKMLDGTLAAKEDTALKAYFKQQGLTQQEAESAMAAFKAEKAKNQPDVGAMQSELEQAKAALAQVPFVLKLADLTGAVGKDGKPDTEGITKAINAVLEAVPAFKPQAQQQAGFVPAKVGAGSTPQQQAGQQAPQQPAIKRWNRFSCSSRTFLGVI